MSSSNQVLKEGWLLKWINYIKGYKKRWFILTPSELSYYRKRESSVCQGNIQLLDIVVINMKSSSSFIASNGDSILFYLQAENENQKHQWVTSIELAKIHAIQIAESDKCTEAFKEENNHLKKFLKVLSSNVKELSSCYEFLKNSGSSLQIMLSDLKVKEDENDPISKLNYLDKKASHMEVTLTDTLNVFGEFVDLAKVQMCKFEKMMEQIYQYWQHMEKIICQLSSENSNLSAALQGLEFHITSGPYYEEEFYDAMDVAPSELFTSFERDSTRAEKYRSGLLEDYRSHAKVVEDLISEKPHISPVSEKTLLPFPHSLQKGLDITPLEGKRLRRTSIPDKPLYGLSIWSIMKNIQKGDFSKISIPISFNEPLSAIQRLTEDYEHAYLLHTAALCDDSLEQMTYVAAFAISAYANSRYQTGKPFNPLLGETYECNRLDDLGWRCISEQVLHYPPISALHCEGNGWIAWQEFSLSMSLKGTHLSANPLGICHVEFSESGNHYTWEKVSSTVYGLVFGTVWLDHHGEMEIINHKTGEICTAQFLQYKYFQNQNQRKVSGVIKDKNSNPQWVLQGKWDEKVEVLKIPLSDNEDEIENNPPKVIWENIFIQQNEAKYNMSVFACQLNEPEEDVAPTDSRFRPDQRLMEQGKWEEANKTKLELEQKQRQRREENELKVQDISENGENICFLQKELFIWNILFQNGDVQKCL